MEKDNIIPFLPYRLFFLYIEPVSALLGAIYAARPAEYLSFLTLTSISSQTPPTEASSSQVRMVLYQLSNLYLLFALNERLVLSSTDSLRTWRRLLFCLLVADFGHLATMAPLGLDAYWKVWEWNAMLWGSIGFVYAGASMRLAFLLGIGIKENIKEE
ncbi:hypothetical protein ACEPAG_6720 [Sanghuangporus baumii]